MGDTHDVRTCDVAVLGGGPAGLSAALTLARAQRSVLVIDAGTPRNAPAAAAHGLLGREGVNPLELLTTGTEEISSYGAGMIRATVHDVVRSSDGEFTLRMDDMTVVQADQLVLATGVRDEFPDIPGLATRWGKDVVHCPYCHGWEIRDQRIGLMATGEMSALQALMFHQWSDHVWFFPGNIEFAADQLGMLAAVGITTIPGAVTGVDIVEDHLAGVTMSDGTRISLDALAVPTLTRARLEGLERLGLDLENNAMGTAVAVDSDGRTSVAGIWAAGNLSHPGMQVSEAAANGSRVAMTLNTELVFAEAAQALEAATNATPEPE